MTKCIRVTTTLFFYDGVQVFDATDAIGGRYVGVLIDGTSDGESRYMVVGVSPENLQVFRLGQMDLRSLIENRPESDWFTADVGIDLRQPVALRAQDNPIPEVYLPEAGFLLGETPRAQTVAVRDEALARQRVAMELTLEPPESAGDHLIRANKLGGLLLHLQRFIRHAYVKSIENLTTAERRMIDRTNAPLLDVAVPAMPGSFRLILVATQLPDLFGGGEITRALAVVDDIASVSDDPDETLNRLKKYRGHTVSSYLGLLRFITENDVSMRYAWAEPNRPGISAHGITRRQAEPLLAVLGASESLALEQVTLVGPLRKIDVDAGTWRLNVIDEDKDYSGKVRPGVSLSHLETDQMYRFVCDEEEEISGTGREVRTLYLTVATRID
jgi:hypothetical protein